MDNLPPKSKTGYTIIHFLLKNIPNKKNPDFKDLLPLISKNQLKEPEITRASVENTIYIGMDQRQHEDLSAARKTLNNAREQALKLKDPYEKFSMLYGVLDAQRLAGFLKDADDTKSVLDEMSLLQKADVQQTILNTAISLLIQGQEYMAKIMFRVAATRALELTDPSERRDALKMVILSQENAGFTEDAENTKSLLREFEP